MNKRLDILEESILKEIRMKYAKVDKTIEEHTNDLLDRLEILKKFNCIPNDRIYDLVYKSCIYHDLGKVNNEFQQRILNANLKYNDSKEVPHNILSLYMIDKNKFNNEEEYLKVAHSVIHHHNYSNVFEDIKNKTELINYLLKDFNTCNIKKSTISKLAKEELINDNETILVKGFLHKCDYSASANKTIEYKNDFLLNSLDNFISNIKSKNEEANWNELQQFCIENRNNNIIAVAQTGMGKTEGGLLWIGDNKGFFILPLRSAINSIYDRIRTTLLNNKMIDKRLAILHSNSLEYYLNNIKYDSEINMLNYHQQCKSLSIPLSISTLDQLFDFVFKYNSYELKLATLSYSKIVIDEIQAYDPTLLAYLIYGIEKIAAIGGKIAIVTATLPPFIRNLLKKNINFVESDKEFTNDEIRHNVKVIESRINSHDILYKYNENKRLQKYNKILVVCNTIKEAQKLYEELSNSINKEELHILHSKFIRKDRLHKEKEIMQVGKTYDNNNNLDKRNEIWLSTSIVEASLDIDFDYLFTELQDLNSLFQRLGRCNRKGAKEVEEYNCFVYTEIDNSIITNKINEKGFIDRTLYDLSKQAIKSINGKLSETKKIDLINKYLTTEKMKNSDYIRKYNEIYEFICNIQAYKFQKKDIDLRNILSKDIIPSSVYEAHINDIKQAEMKLKDNNTNLYDKIKLKDYILQYSVSVLEHDANSYTDYKKVYLNNNDYIKVVNCIYDESGYKRN